LLNVAYRFLAIVVHEKYQQHLQEKYSKLTDYVSEANCFLPQVKPQTSNTTDQKYNTPINIIHTRETKTNTSTNTNTKYANGKQLEKTMNYPI
jgi:hypothetical protein